jgi:methionyl-tRNA formyltransferase
MAGLNVIFMGTPEFSVSALKALHESAHNVVAVYSQPPRPKGRGQQVQNSPVHDYAAQNNIPVFTPKSVKNAEAQAQFAALNADIAVVAAYGLILPRAILDAPKYGCLNIHASLLPRWRGASPIQQSIWQGDEKTGICIMQMDEGLDTGPVIAERAVAITPQTTASSLHDELVALGAGMIVDVINKFADQGAQKSKPQDNARATYAPLLRKEDGKIDWRLSADALDRQIRALNPWPGVYADHNGARLKILAAVPAPQYSDAKPGTVLDRQGHIACGTGVLQLLKIQPQNAKAMDFSSAVNGGLLTPGDVLQ